MRQKITNNRIKNILDNAHNTTLIKHITLLEKDVLEICDEYFKELNLVNLDYRLNVFQCYPGYNFSITFNQLSEVEDRILANAGHNEDNEDFILQDIFKTILNAKEVEIDVSHIGQKNIFEILQYV